MPPEQDSTESSELAHVDDTLGFDDFLESQASRGVAIVGADRDRLRSTVFFDSSDDLDTVAPNNLKLSTGEW